MRADSASGELGAEQCVANAAVAQLVADFERQRASPAAERERYFDLSAAECEEGACAGVARRRLPPPN